MGVFRDASGTWTPVAFFTVAFVLFLATAHPKRKRWAWLTFVPLACLYPYQMHMQAVQLEEEQWAYIRTTWSATYEPQRLNAERKADWDTPTTDAWSVETEGGAYRVVFNTGEAKGVQIQEIMWETEPLIGRQNVWQILNMLEISGDLQWQSDGTYQLNAPDTAYTITLTADHHVLSVVAADETPVYRFESTQPLTDGHAMVLEEE